MTSATDLSTRFDVVGDELVRTIEINGRCFRSSIPSSEPARDLLGSWWRSYLAGVRPTVDGPAARKVRTVELFCGPGGLALGFRQACAELGAATMTLAAIDHDPDAVAVYTANHHPQTTSTESVSVLVDYRVKGTGDNARFRYPPETLDDELRRYNGAVDVLLAGPPCQGHSNLNNHSRRDDLRNELYLTVPAVAVAMDIPIVVIENVPAVVHDRTGVVATTIHLLEQAGYQVETGVLKADRMGWAQRRSRFFVVASRLAAPCPILAIAAMLEDEPRSISWAIEDVADLPEDGHMVRHPEFSAENQRRIDWLFDNEAYDLPLSERPECHQDGTTYLSVYGRLRPDQAAPTITTGFMTPGRGRYIHPTRRRVITPLEAARLQGFPDTYDFRHPDGRPPTSAKLGKWIGDAVPMPLGFAAGLAVVSSCLS